MIFAWEEEVKDLSSKTSNNDLLPDREKNRHVNKVSLGEAFNTECMQRTPAELDSSNVI